MLQPPPSPLQAPEEHTGASVQPGRVEQVGLRLTNGGTAVVLNKQTFWVAVLSSARQVARFLEHWPSCIAAAWSVTVGTAALADVTILLQG